mmetsp:Transcript_32494/g.52659  ORF Transcript_32494/g.52659 Transcript_32494/m.52659 type:complete len:370 (+) Transcript_32494:1905-3014(+)
MFSSSHEAACVLKAYFRQLQDPIIPQDKFVTFTKAAADWRKNENKSTVDNGTSTKLAMNTQKRIDQYSNLVGQLPHSNLIVLHYLMWFLSKVAAQSEKNKMPEYNLAIVWAPNLLRPPLISTEAMLMVKHTIDCIEFLIRYQALIFGNHSEPAPKVSSPQVPSRRHRANSAANRSGRRWRNYIDLLSPRITRERSLTNPSTAQEDNIANFQRDQRFPLNKNNNRGSIPSTLLSSFSRNDSETGSLDSTDPDRDLLSLASGCSSIAISGNEFMESLSACQYNLMRRSSADKKNMKRQVVNKVSRPLTPAMPVLTKARSSPALTDTQSVRPVTPLLTLKFRTDAPRKENGLEPSSTKLVRSKLNVAIAPPK